MKTYDVWTAFGVVTVKAEGIRRVTLDDKPIKIYFYIADDIVAEFYTEHVCGWAERKEDMVK